MRRATVDRGFFCRSDAISPQSWGCRRFFLLLRPGYGLRHPHATAKRLRGGDGDGLELAASTIVIASAAKQSRIPPREDSGLLRCARNDGARGSIAILQCRFQLADTPLRPRGTNRPSFAWSLHPLIQEGAGK